MSEFKLNKDYGKNVFNDAMMKKYLPKTVYEKLKKTISDGVELDSSLSKYVANGIMNWAVENGATHYTHWFEPLNDSIAEKQNSFLRTD